MNLRDLKYLVALADHKHFGRAATACFVSQPTLSTQIKKLEDELGVPLVERAPRKVMLTPAGREAAMRARSIVAEVEQMKEAARRSQDPEAGTVRLGIFPTLAPYLLPHVVPRIRERFPRLELLLIEEKATSSSTSYAKAAWTPHCWPCRCRTSNCMPNSCSKNPSYWRCRKAIRCRGTTA